MTWGSLLALLFYASSVVAAYLIGRMTGEERGYVRACRRLANLRKSEMSRGSL